jgi:hypothetical protein
MPHSSRPARTRIVNLMPHVAVLDVHDATGSPVRAVRIPPEGQAARVGDPVVGQATLDTDDGLVSEARLRRNRTVSNLPEPQASVVYLVSRLTALAARHRRDLVFPFDEYRNGGSVAGAHAVARFQPWWAVSPADVSRRVRSQVRGWTGRLVAPYWLITVAFALSTALAGAALGVVPSLLEHGWRRWSGTALILLGGLAVLLGVVGVMLWRRRNRLLDERGTAYVIDEVADVWTYEEKRSFLTSTHGQFASVLRVPGPADFGDTWSWPLGAGAEEWDGRVNDLVRSFWATHYNDDHVTANAVFAWAAWPLAVAFAARAVALRRGLVLQVRQRPSFGRMGVRDRVDWSQPAWSFEQPSTGRASTGLVPREEISWTAQLQVTPRRSPAPPPSGTLSPSVRLLLVRMTDGPWGPLSLATSRSASLRVPMDDAADTGLSGAVDTTITEWRCLPPAGAHHPWDSFPTLAQAAADWLCSMAGSYPDDILLLGTLVPQEVALGLGICAARLNTLWPKHLWPLSWVQTAGGGKFVVPSVDLGSAPLVPKGR